MYKSQSTEFDLITNFVFSQTKCLYLFSGRMYPPVLPKHHINSKNWYKKKLMLVKGQT